MKDNPRTVQRQRPGVAALLPGLDRELAAVAAKHTDLAMVYGEGETILVHKYIHSGGEAVLMPGSSRQAGRRPADEQACD